MDRGQEVRELKLGASFTSPNARSVFHSLKCKCKSTRNFITKNNFFLPHPTFLSTFSSHSSHYLDDFKPASVDVHKEATLETGSNNTVTVTLPHLGKYHFSICFVIIFSWDFYIHFLIHFNIQQHTFQFRWLWRSKHNIQRQPTWLQQERVHSYNKSRDKWDHIREVT